MNSNLFEFIVLLGKLKTTKRTGWVRSGVNNPESIADHMYRMGMLSMIVDPSSGLDKDKCVKLSLVHDLAESIVGDITPNCGVSIGNKYLMEKSAMIHIKTLLPPKISDEIVDLWQEYEDQKTAEAKFVKDLDKFDMIFQAFEYEKYVFETPQVKSWAKCLNEIRNSPNNVFDTFNERIEKCKKTIIDSIKLTEKSNNNA